MTQDNTQQPKGADKGARKDARQDQDRKGSKNQQGQSKSPPVGGAKQGDASASKRSRD